MSLNNSSSRTFQFILRCFAIHFIHCLNVFIGEDVEGRKEKLEKVKLFLSCEKEQKGTVGVPNFFATYLKDFVSVDLLSSLTVNFCRNAFSNNSPECIGGKFSDTKQLIVSVSAIVCRMNCFSTTIC